MDKYFNKKIFGERLLELMNDNGDSTYDLAKYLHLSQATISRYTNGDMAPKRTTIEVISRKYNVNPAWLMGAEGVDKYNICEIYDFQTRYRKVPILGEVACGKPIYAQENIEGFETVPYDDSVDFCLRVKGDSMIGVRICDGDIVYVKEQPDVENGDIAVVLINDEATIKRVYKYNSTIVLRPENPAYKEMVFKKSDGVNIKILGKVKYFKSKV